ncbi:MAG: DUF433 domain-containing protein [Dehalococcoidia bacterium]
MPYQRPDLDRIVEDPNILVGKPTVKGTRISVELVLEQLAYNLDLAELFAAYPDLVEADICACLAFARLAVKRSSRSQKGRQLRTSAHSAMVRSA